MINNLRLLVEGRGHLGACIMHVELMHVEVGVCHELVGSLLANVAMLAKVAACRDSSCSPRRFRLVGRRLACASGGYSSAAAKVQLAAELELAEEVRALRGGSPVAAKVRSSLPRRFADERP